MRQWFTWKGIDSRTMGVEVHHLPPVVKPAERVTYTAIPGRAGDVSIKEGADVYDGYQKTLTVFLRRDRDPAPITEWLRGHGTAVFANEPNREYVADVASQVEFARVTNSLYQAQVAFYCQPLKRQFPHEADVTVNEETISLINLGDVASHPILMLSAVSGETGRLNINGETYTFTSGGLWIDCEAGIARDASGMSTAALEVFSDGFPELVQGENRVGAFGWSDGVTIRPRWRWV